MTPLVINTEMFDGREFYPNWACDALEQLFENTARPLTPEDILDALFGASPA